MAIIKDEGRIGGKFCKRPLRVFPSTPYDRPPSAVRGISRQQPENEAGRSGWFSKLVDSTAQIIVKGVSRLSSVFGKGVASTPGENINTIEEVAEMKSPPEVNEEKPDNHIDITLSIRYDGTDESKEELISHIDAFFLLKQLNKKDNSRAETGQLGELLYSRTIGTPGYQKKKVEIINNSNINPSSSHQIREEDFGKFFTFGCKSQINHNDCQNNFMTQKVTRKSEMYSMARSPFFGSSLMTNTRVLKRGSSDRDERFFDDERRVRQKTCLKDLNLTTHAGTSSTPIILDQEQKRGSSDRDEQCFDDSRRVGQKSCLKDLNLTIQAGTSSTPIILDQEQKLGSSDRDEQCLDDDARRVGQKSCWKDLNLTTQAGTSSAPIILDQEQKHGSSDRDEQYLDDYARRVGQKSCWKDLNLTTQAGTSSAPIILDQEQKHGSSDRDEQYLDDYARRVRQKSCWKDLNLTTHAGTSSTLIILDQEQKLGSSDRDEQYLDDYARRVRQKSCWKDLNLTTHAGTSSTLIILDQEQRRHRIDSKGFRHSGFQIPLTCDLFAPLSRSAELGKRTLDEINKL